MICMQIRCFRQCAKNLVATKKWKRN